MSWTQSSVRTLRTAGIEMPFTATTCSVTTRAGRSCCLARQARHRDGNRGNALEGLRRTRVTAVAPCEGGRGGVHGEEAAGVGPGGGLRWSRAGVAAVG